MTKDETLEALEALFESLRPVVKWADSLEERVRALESRTEEKSEETDD